MKPGFTCGSDAVQRPNPYVRFRLRGGGRSYDIALDGQRFLFVKDDMGQATEDQSERQINVVLDWFQELTERVPVP